MTTITIYDADKVGPPSFLPNADLWLTAAWPEYRTHAGIIWTDKTGGPGDEPTTLTIITMARQWVFRAPRLVLFNNRLQVLSVLSDHDASGTARTIKKYYILVEKTCDD